VIVTGEHVLRAAHVCERAFAFLVEDYAYQSRGTTLGAGGFTLRYLGSDLGVEVDWHPRDPLTVWLVRLVGGDFPARMISLRPGSALNYFDLEDLEEISGHTRQVGRLQLYSLPNDENALLLANNLRTYADDLLRGDLTRLSQLEQRILDRARAAAIERHGGEGAARLGW
jgi:hypothetical protein